MIRKISRSGRRIEMCTSRKMRHTRGLCLLFVLLAVTLFSGVACAGEQEPLNILLLVADDMNYDSLGFSGSKSPNITPNLDKLAKQGMRFTNAHVQSAICQPSRSVLMTGRYPHRNGAMGFSPIKKNVPTLQEELQKAGYLNGILSKTHHLVPESKFCWDYMIKRDDLGEGRDPKLYYKHAKIFFEKAKKEGKPFFLMANSNDPHRPFAGSQQEKQTEKKQKARFPKPSRTYKSKEVQVPKFLPNLPDIRKEVAEYYTSVHRCDETIGEVLRALKDTGFEDNTLVMYVSDNGMALPFSKTNCYVFSTLTPWIVKWPGKVKKRKMDKTHMISGIDFMPTILDAAGVKLPEGLDGRSFVPVLKGDDASGWDQVFTFITSNSQNMQLPMRGVHTTKYAYIFSAWADGKTAIRNDGMTGLSFKAMQAASNNNKKIAERMRFYEYRVPEEFYLNDKDPNALKNLIDQSRYKKQINEMRKALLEMMVTTKDPLLLEYRKYLKGQGIDLES